MDTRPVSAADHRGKVMAIVFWSGWWPPALAALPQMREFQRRYEGKPFVVIGVSGDESLKSVEKFARQEQFTWPCLFDGNTGRGPIATKWGISAWPTIIVVDAGGVIRHVGHDPAKLESIIDGLVAKAK